MQSSAPHLHAARPCLPAAPLPLHYESPSCPRRSPLPPSTCSRFSSRSAIAEPEQPPWPTSELTHCHCCVPPLPEPAASSRSPVRTAATSPLRQRRQLPLLLAGGAAVAGPCRLVAGTARRASAQAKQPNGCVLAPCGSPAPPCRHRRPATARARPSVRLCVCRKEEEEGPTCKRETSSGGFLQN
jgi:hypothetical protein